MEKILQHNIPTSDLKRFEEQYQEQLLRCQKVDPQAQFEYAWCLVQSCYHGNIHKGIILLEDLISHSAPEGGDTRDYLFYIAIGYTRLKEHKKALRNVRELLTLEPENQQAQELEKLIAERLRKERVSGALVAGGTALALGGVVGALGLVSGGTLARLAPLAWMLIRR